MIVVTGATGKLGGKIVRALLARTSAEDVVATTREPANAEALLGLGVQVRRGDFADPASLPEAFAGARQVLVVSSNASATGGDPVAQHRAAFQAARAAGAERVVYVSHMAASTSSAFPPMRDHARTEAALAELGVAWTALRNGFYADSGVDLLGDGPTKGAFEAPVDGPVCWTAHDDLAEAAAVVLTSAAGRFDGPTPPLTGAELVDLAGLAALASAIVGRPVERKTIDDATLVARLVARGIPASYGAVVTGLYEAARAGEFARTDGTLAELLGRAPITLRAVLEARLRP